MEVMEMLTPRSVQCSGKRCGGVGTASVMTASCAVPAAVSSTVHDAPDERCWYTGQS